MCVYIVTCEFAFMHGNRILCDTGVRAWDICSIYLFFIIVITAQARYRSCTVQTCFDRLQNEPKQTCEEKENNGKRERISFKYIIQEFRLSHLESESNSVWYTGYHCIDLCLPVLWTLLLAPLDQPNEMPLCGYRRINICMLLKTIQRFIYLSLFLFV